MRYCKPNLHTLNLDTFEYPELHVWVGNEDYGNLDRQEVVKVYFRQPFAGRSTDHFVFHGYPYLENVDEIREFVKDFNRDPKKNWNSVLIELLTHRETQILDNIAGQKRTLKETRKTIKKLQEKDK